MLLYASQATSTSKNRSPNTITSCIYIFSNDTNNHGNKHCRSSKPVARQPPGLAKLLVLVQRKVVVLDCLAGGNCLPP